jgi:beta-xylosidase
MLNCRKLLRVITPLIATLALLFITSIAHANPLSDFSAADPCLVRANGKLYLYSTGWGWGRGAFPIGVAANDDLTSWTDLGYVFEPGKDPEWTKKDSRFWAPEVHFISGKYVCYFTAEDTNNRFCIGTATAEKPEGPFQPQKTPIASNPKVGLIDATYYRDPNSVQAYLVWKEDSNDLSPQQPTNLYMQKVSANGLSCIGKPWPILVNDAPWEGELVEGPSIIYRKGFYYLFYSGNVFVDDRYGVGVARSKKIEGPYEKFRGNPILKSDEHFSGPGHQFLLPGKGDEWTMFYHARDKSRQKSASSRLLMKDEVRWDEAGWPHVNDGTPSEGKVAAHQP